MSIGNCVQVAWSWVIKMGLPLVAFYHIVTENVILNTSFTDSRGIEHVANTILIPVQYLFAGRLVTCSNDHLDKFEIKQRFDYQELYILKSTLSIVTFPASLVLGIGMKALAFSLPKCRERHRALKRFISSPIVDSMNDIYRSMGLEVRDLSEAVVLESSMYERGVDAKDHLKEEKEALKEIIALFNEHKIVYWVDCGTCLGTYRYRGAIPWDEDIDIAILQPDFNNALHVLGGLSRDKYVAQDWSSRSKPGSYIRVYIRETKSHIDVFHFQINSKTKTVSSILSYEKSWFLPHSWKVRESGYTVETPFEYIFPLKKAFFDGIEVCVPNQTEKYLQLRYGEDLRPVKIFDPITAMYEKDMSHPYWQRAFVY